MGSNGGPCAFSLCFVTIVIACSFQVKRKTTKFIPTSFMIVNLAKVSKTIF